MSLLPLLLSKLTPLPVCSLLENSPNCLWWKPEIHSFTSFFLIPHIQNLSAYLLIIITGLFHLLSILTVLTLVQAMIISVMTARIACKFGLVKNLNPLYSLQFFPNSEQSDHFKCKVDHFIKIFQWFTSTFMLKSKIVNIAYKVLLDPEGGNQQQWWGNWGVGLTGKWAVPSPWLPHWWSSSRWRWSVAVAGGEGPVSRCHQASQGGC